MFSEPLASHQFIAFLFISANDCFTLSPREFTETNLLTYNQVPDLEGFCNSYSFYTSLSGR